MSVDIIVLVVLLFLILGGILHFGKSVGVAIIFSIPITAFLYDRLPFLEKITTFAKGSVGIEVVKVLVFIILLLVVYIVVRKAVSVVFPWNPLPKVFEGSVITIIVFGLLVTTLSTYIDPSFITSHLPFVSKILNIPNILFWWMVGSMFSLIFILNQN